MQRSGRAGEPRRARDGQAARGGGGRRLNRSTSAATHRDGDMARGCAAVACVARSVGGGGTMSFGVEVQRVVGGAAAAAAEVGCRCRCRCRWGWIGWWGLMIRQQHDVDGAEATAVKCNGEAVSKPCGGGGGGGRVGGCVPLRWGWRAIRLKGGDNYETRGAECGGEGVTCVCVCVCVC